MCGGLNAFTPLVLALIWKNKARAISKKYLFFSLSNVIFLRHAYIGRLVDNLVILKILDDIIIKILFSIVKS